MKTILTLVCLVLLSGCSIATPRYNVSVDNIETMRALTKQSGKKIKIESKKPEFTVSEDDYSGRFDCRAVGTIVPPDNMAYDTYIINGIVDELRMSEAYDSKSEYSFKIVFNAIDFDSSMGTSDWTIDAIITRHDGKKFGIKNIYEFEGNYVGDQACNKVAQMLPNAVQEFTKKLIQHEAFKESFK